MVTGNVVHGVSRGCNILAEVIVIAVTWFRMRSQVKEVLDPKLRVKTSTVMLADGE